MSSDRKGKGREKRHISPDADEGSSKRTRQIASGDVSLPSFSESFGSMSISTTSRGQVQAYSLPPVPASGYQAFSQTSSQLFSDNGDAIMTNPVAAGRPYDMMRRETFPYQQALDIQAPSNYLESHEFQGAGGQGQAGASSQGQRYSVPGEQPGSRPYYPYAQPSYPGASQSSSQHAAVTQGRDCRSAGRHGQAGASHQGQRYPALNEQLDNQTYHPYAQPSDSSAGQPSSQHTAVTQGLAGRSNLPAPTYASAGEAHQSIQPSHEPGRTVPDNIPWSTTQGENTRYRILLQENLHDIRLKIAQGRSFMELQAEYCPDYSYPAMHHFLTSTCQCHLWSKVQNNRLWDLRAEGYNWAQISEMLPDPPRAADEVEARFGFLLERRRKRLEKRQQRRRR